MIATSLFVSLFIALFLPLRPLLRAMIGSQWLCILWLALLARLLMPWPVETRWGVMNLWESQVTAPALPAGPLLVKVSFPAGPVVERSEHAIPPSPVAATPPVTPARSVNLPFLIWLAGFLTALAFLAWRGIQTARLARKTQPASDERLLAIFSSIPAHLRRYVALRTSSAVQVPTLAGLLHPQIWMPPAWLAQFSDDELRCILLHELGHARRGDLAVQCLFAIAACLHWFNPLVWLASRAARLDREMACDAWVLSLDSNAPPAYGETLLTTVQLLRGPQRVPATMVAMASGRHTLRARIAGIGSFQPARAWRGLLGVALMITALTIATSRRTIAQSPAPAATASPLQATPAPATQPVTKPAASPASSQPPIIRLETKFVGIDLPAWIKMRAEDPAFRDATAMVGNFENAGNEYPAPSVSGTVADAATLAALDALGRKNWSFKDGSWQTVGGLFGVTVLAEKPFQKILRYMDGRTGFDLLSAPAVTTPSGQHAMIEVVREFRYPDDFELDAHHPGIWFPDHFVTQNLGLTLNVTSSFETSGNLANTVGLDLNPEISDFLGFLPEKSGGKIKVGPMHPSPGYWRPIFSFTRGKTQLNILPDQTVMLAGVNPDPNYGRTRTNEPQGTGTELDAVNRDVIVVFVTPSIVAPEGIPVTDAKPPYAKTMPGKPGFVTSPYTGGYVDVRGFPKDTQIKDPYTGKIFLVP